ncbi:hypothetical protein CON22_17955 [Bacillus cereus]|nr:hypothetical protein CON22_17955 [Bacillus cereus]
MIKIIDSKILVTVMHKNDAQNIAKRMIQTVLHEDAGTTWIKATQSFLSAAIFYMKETYNENVSFQEIQSFIAHSDKNKYFLKNVIKSLDLNHPSYHAFQNLLLSKERTRILVFSLSKLSVRETIRYQK